MNRRSVLKSLALASGLSHLGSPFTSAASARARIARKPGKLHKLRDVVIYRNERKYCGPGPGVAVLKDARVMVAFRRVDRLPGGLRSHQDPRTEICTLISVDGTSWKAKPRQAYFGDYQTVALTATREGTLLLAHHSLTLIPEPVFDEIRSRFANQEGVNTGFPPGLFRPRGWPMAEAGPNIFRSTDQGGSWDGPHYVKVEGYPALLEGKGSPMDTRTPVVELSDGPLVFAVYTLEQPTSALLVGSRDGGLSWRLRGIIAKGESSGLGFNETMVHECPSGELVAFMRAQFKGSPLDTHGLYTSRSTDAGRTWRPPRREEGVIGHPFGTTRLASGNVLLVYGRRVEPFGIRARLLNPECEDIAGAEEVVLRDDGGGWDLGYPLAATLGDGRAIVVYYMNDKGDRANPPYVEGGWGTRYIAATIVAER